MVIDYIENKDFYNFIHKDFEKGMAFALTLKDKAPGKYDFSNFFAVVQTGKTNHYTKGKIESHLKYLDVHIMVEGEEMLGYETKSRLTLSKKYDENTDAAFYKGDTQNIKIQKEMFVILHTKDCHRSCTHINNETEYKKIVLKLPLY